MKNQVRLTLRHIPRQKRMGIEESEFSPAEVEVEIPRDQAALVLVDTWDSHHITSHQHRCEAVTINVIKPLLEVARQSGLYVIHAPGPEVAWKYPQCPDYDHSIGDQWLGQKDRRKGKPLISPTPPDPDVAALRKDRKISPHLLPMENEAVVATGDHLLDILSKSNIQYLFYAGFAANICIPYRDYGMRAMHGTGHEVILVRDATTAVETLETFASEQLLQNAITDVEMNFGASVLSTNLICGLKE